MRLLSIALLACLASSYALAGTGDNLEDLGNDLLGGDLLKQLGEGGDAPGVEVPSLDELKREIEELNRGLEKPPIGEDLGQPSQSSPLKVVQNKMETAESLIRDRETGGKTKQVQGEIVSELDKLIEQLEKQCKNCKNGQCNKPGSKQQQTAKSTPKPGAPKPGDQQTEHQANSDSPSAPNQSQQSAQQSNARPQGGVASADEKAVDPQDMVKELWGQLPDRMRQQMLQSSFDDFLPEYRDDIEAYFQRLADPER